MVNVLTESWRVWKLIQTFWETIQKLASTALEKPFARNQHFTTRNQSKRKNQWSEQISTYQYIYLSVILAPNLETTPVPNKEWLLVNEENYRLLRIHVIK